MANEPREVCFGEVVATYPMPTCAKPVFDIATNAVPEGGPNTMLCVGMAWNFRLQDGKLYGIMFVPIGYDLCEEGCMSVMMYPTLTDKSGAPLPETRSGATDIFGFFVSKAA
jgi:hypothetical protein